MPDEAALVWSRAIKERDGGRCVVCGEKDELSAESLIDDGSLKVKDGVTLCATCKMKKYPVEELCGYVTKRRPTMRLNVNIDADLYARLQAVAKQEGRDVSTVIRKLAVRYVEEVSRG